MKTKIALFAGFMAMAGLVSCDEADTVSHNLSKDADNFKVARKIVFYNGITDAYIATVEGRCSLNADGADQQLEVTCKVGDNEYEKHFLGLSDNVTYFALQAEPQDVNPYHFKVVFRPQTIVPDIDLRGDANALADTVTE